MKSIYLSLFVSLMFTTTVYGAGDKLLKGHIGGTEIIMLLEEGKSGIHAEYFEASNGKAIHIYGKIEEDYFQLKSERYRYGSEVKKEYYEYFSFCEYEKGQFIGTREINGETKTLVLRIIDSGKESPYRMMENYRTNLINSLEFKIEDTVTSQDYQLVNYTYLPEGVSGYRHSFHEISFPRIVSHPKSQEINTILDSLQRQYIHSYMLCSSRINESDYSVNLAHIYIDSYFISLLVKGEKCCEVRCHYPQDAYNILLESGAQINISDILITSEDSIPYILLEKFIEFYPKEYARGNDRYCPVNKIDYWKYPIWYIKKDSIAVLTNGISGNSPICLEYWHFPIASPTNRRL